MFKKPDWYVTPQEFADLVVEVMEEQKYFSRDEFAHPEDIMNTMNLISEAVSAGMSYAGRRVHEAQKKQAVMTPKDLRKVVLPDDPEYPVQ